MIWEWYSPAFVSLHEAIEAKAFRSRAQEQIERVCRSLNEEEQSGDEVAGSKRHMDEVSSNLNRRLERGWPSDVAEPDHPTGPELYHRFHRLRHQMRLQHRARHDRRLFDIVRKDVLGKISQPRPIHEEDVLAAICRCLAVDERGHSTIAWDAVVPYIYALAEKPRERMERRFRTPPGVGWNDLQAKGIPLGNDLWITDVPYRVSGGLRELRVAGVCTPRAQRDLEAEFLPPLHSVLEIYTLLVDIKELKSTQEAFRRGVEHARRILGGPANDSDRPWASEPSFGEVAGGLFVEAVTAFRDVCVPGSTEKLHIGNRRLQQMLKFYSEAAPLEVGPVKFLMYWCAIESCVSGTPDTKEKIANRIAVLLSSDVGSRSKRVMTS